MKAYLLITGMIFGLVGIAHLLRLFVESNWTDIGFVGGNALIFLIGTGMAFWAARLLKSIAKSSEKGGQ